MISITYTINTYIRFCKLISITYLAPYFSHGITTTILDNLIFLNDFYLSNQLMQISILFICFYICKIRFQSLIKYKSEGKVAESFMGSHSRNLVTTEFWDEKTASENEWWTAKKSLFGKSSEVHRAAAVVVWPSFKASAVLVLSAKAVRSAAAMLPPPPYLPPPPVFLHMQFCPRPLLDMAAHQGSTTVRGGGQG